MALYCPDHSGTAHGVATIPVTCPRCIIATLRAKLEEARFYKDATENQVAMLCEKIDAEQVVFDDMKARAEKAEAALAALDAAVSERHLPCEDGIVGGCEVCFALRDAKEEG